MEIRMRHKTAARVATVRFRETCDFTSPAPSSTIRRVGSTPGYGCGKRHPSTAGIVHLGPAESATIVAPSSVRSRGFPTGAHLTLLPDTASGPGPGENQTQRLFRGRKGLQAERIELCRSRPGEVCSTAEVPPPHVSDGCV